VSEARALAKENTGTAPGRAGGYTRHILLIGAVLVLAFPFFATPFPLDLANQFLLASIGALALMMLTGFAGQISLGHAGLMAAGAFTVGIMFREFDAPFWVTLPLATLLGAMIGVLFGLPSLRLRGLYLAVSTLALHFIVIYVGNEYESARSFSAGILVDPPIVFGIELYGGFIWYFILLASVLVTYFICSNLISSRTGRAWAMIRTKETVAAALGVHVGRAKLLAFVSSSAMTGFAGGLFAYYRGFVSIEAFSLFLAVQYVAMIIIGGMGSLPGALLGAAFVTVLPYGIEGILFSLPGASRYAGAAFAANYAAFGLIMILFLAFEPHGLVGIWRRIVARFKRRPAAEEERL
jgi:branched-chain amino acid transport system permease protein